MNPSKPWRVGGMKELCHVLDVIVGMPRTVGLGFPGGVPCCKYKLKASRASAYPKTDDR